ncbi:MAG: hypothetical protein ACR2N4_18525 [Jatrophihabitans sp.]
MGQHEASQDSDNDGSSVEAAAEQGQLPGVAALDAAEEEGREDSSTADPDADAQEAADGDVVGGINMH